MQGDIPTLHVLTEGSVDPTRRNWLGLTALDVVRLEWGSVPPPMRHVFREDSGLQTSGEVDVCRLCAYLTMDAGALLAGS